MNPMRIYFLRLFLSLLLLPLTAVLVLALLHATVFPDTYFNDFPAVILSWIVLLFLVHYLLSKAGENRFQKLDQLGWQFLQTSDTHGLTQIFNNLETLFSGGLLSRKQHDKLEKLLLRRYFAYYQENVAERRCREALLKCLRYGIRANETFSVLKAFLFKQPLLTMELVDLAEVLHEYRPEDQAIPEFMARRYLQEGQKHHRAEYFYGKALENESELSADIIALCLPRTLHHGRKNTFAGWLCLRAYQQQPNENESALPRQIYRISRWYETTARDDTLAKELQTVVAGFDESLIAGWEQEEEQHRQRQLSARLARLHYQARQRLLFWWDEVLRYKKYVFPTAGGVAVIALLYLFWPASEPQTESAPEPVNPVISDSDARFSLQVAALKSASRAQREIERLRQAGLDATLVPPSGRSSYYRIRLGKFLTKNDALAEGEALRQQELIRDFFVVNFARQSD